MQGQVHVDPADGRVASRPARIHTMPRDPTLQRNGDPRAPAWQHHDPGGTVPKRPPLQGRSLAKADCRPSCSALKQGARRALRAPAEPEHRNPVARRMRSAPALRWARATLAQATPRAQNRPESGQGVNPVRVRCPTHSHSLDGTHAQTCQPCSTPKPFGVAASLPATVCRMATAARRYPPRWEARMAYSTRSGG